MSANRLSLRTAFKKSTVIAPIYTGGPIAITKNASGIVTFTDKVLLTNVADGKQICSFDTDNTEVTTLAVSASSEFLALFDASFALWVYQIPFQPCESPVQPTRKIPRAHDAPVHVSVIDPSSLYLASGSADGVVKVWDIGRGYTTHIFKGHGGVISALHFHTPRIFGNDPRSASVLHLITASVDTRIHVYELSAEASRVQNSKPLAILEGHSSVPRGLSVSRDGKWLLSGGRDAVVLIWDYSQWSKRSPTSKKGKPPAPRVIPVFEPIEALGLLEHEGANSSAPGNIQFYTGGGKGQVCIWDLDTRKINCRLGESSGVTALAEQQGIVDVIFSRESNTLVSVHADQNIIFYSLSTLQLQHQIIGYNDEVIDCTLLSASPNATDSHLALATNSSLLRLYSLDTLDARLLSGHDDIVLCVASAGPGDGQIFGSGSKDNTARIWKRTVGDQESTWRTCGVLQGHTESVGSITFSKKSSSTGEVQYAFTGSQDRTIKMWDLISPDSSTAGEVVKLRTLTTVRAHDKDINALDVSPDDRLLASGSQDKTAKIFEIERSGAGEGSTGTLKLLGALKGHKRGIWDIKFSPTDRSVATASGDRSIKMWSLDDFTCLKTFEGHTNAVLRVTFMNQTHQLVSSGSDGLVKLWDIRDEQCVATLDNHEDKVWALCVSSDQKKIISGAADSLVTVWEDCTDQQKHDRENERADAVLKEQSLTNYLALNDYRNAVVLAISMEQPGRLLNIFRSMKQQTETGEQSYTGHPAVDAVITTLSDEDLTALLKHVRNWNASARTSQVAQTILYAVLKLRPYGNLAALAENGAKPSMPSAMGPNQQKRAQAQNPSVAELVDNLIPYTERHLNRLDRLLQESYVIDTIIAEMDGGYLVDDTNMDVDGIAV